MMNIATQVKTSVPPASESISAAKALFTFEHKRKQVKRIFNSLNIRQRVMICIAGGLSPQDGYRHFDEFDELELQKLRKGLQELKGITTRFEIMGDIKRLTPSHFGA